MNFDILDFLEFAGQGILEGSCFIIGYWLIVGYIVEKIMVDLD